MDGKAIKTAVRKKYAQIAKRKEQGCGCGCAAPETVRLVNYGKLSEGLVEGADLGLGCGIPTKRADIRPGDVVLDLGSGAGADVFLASRQVGTDGQVIGVDMTPEMVERARKNAKRGGYKNVEFKVGDIENLPLQDVSVDVVISNCVINLAPDKHRVYGEIFRVLRPGGRFSICDLVTYGPVPDKIRNDMEQWAGCVAGAMDRDALMKLIDEIGFADLRISDASEYDAFKGKDYGILSITIEGKKSDHT